MAIKTTTKQGRPLRLRNNVPLSLRPVLRAYFLGYLSSTAPRVLTLLLTHLSRRNKDVEGKDSKFLSSLLGILRGGLELQRFPTFCAALVGGATFLQARDSKSVEKDVLHIEILTYHRLTRWISTFIAAWFSLSLLQTKKSDAFIDYVPEETSTGIVHRPVQFAGRTMDLTLFAVTRAIDVIVGELWAQRKIKQKASGKRLKFENLISSLADPSVFAASCALIMWAFIYTPSRLPRSYNKWIKTAAQVDQRLLLALQRTRWGEIQYGVETGQAHLLSSMATDYNLPASYGDPVLSIPYPCELVHMGTGKSCEYHALSRWLRSFTWAFSTYLPLNLLLALRKRSKPAFLKALFSSLRSSAFLGTFIATYYYGICLARTRLGPRLLGTTTSAYQRLDQGLCVASGCMLCGWSVLLEPSGRRKELGLFVVPRALATLFPRRYKWENRDRERMAFAVSVAVVFCAVVERPERVRGVFGRVLGGVLRG
ncbi:hypothetical protein HYFRA_00012678 [Hymenoscyphus fraxineus]|uniref:Integral membrane protein n=1 Tax=Hymenoscyphus fraxineus TaxID=746836 RepID=A0A9N9PU78_9HELO|nr:hypothetical protein HYFRA_00012678 [Hymenoscyphus fraxineus]